MCVGVASEYEAWRPRLIRLLVAKGAGDMAEELADRALEKVWRCEAAGREVDVDDALTAARWALRDWHRDSRPEMEVGLEDACRREPVEQDVDTTVLLADRLTPCQRREVLLRFAGYSDREIAALQNVRRETITRRRSKLRVQLEGE